MAADRLPEDPRGRASHKSIVPGRGGESSRLLSVSEAGGGERGRDGIGRRNSEASRGDAGLWLSADHGGTAPAWDSRASFSQLDVARCAADFDWDTGADADLVQGDRAAGEAARRRSQQRHGSLMRSHCLPR